MAIHVTAVRPASRIQFPKNRKSSEIKGDLNAGYATINYKILIACHAFRSLDFIGG